VKILAPAFFAKQNVATPVKFGIITLLATQLMNIAFVAPLGHVGLALAIALGACLNAALLYVGLRKRGIYQPRPGWGAFAFKLAAAVSLMGFILFMAMGSPAWWLAAGWRLKVPAMLGLVALGAAAYGGALLVLGVRPRDFSRRAAD